MSGLGSALGNGFVNLFKSWGKGIGNAADKLLLSADARKAINDEVVSKFQSRIRHANIAANGRAKNIKDLGDKLNESKANWQKAQDKWRQNRDAELAAAKAQRQTDIDNYKTQLQEYQDAVDKAGAGKQSIFYKLADDEGNYDPSRTLFTDVRTGDKYIFDQITGKKINVTKTYPTLTKAEQKRVRNSIQGYDNRLFDGKSGKVINAFDESSQKQYAGKNNIFDDYYSTKISTQNAALRNADNQINQAEGVLNKWKANNSQPQAWDNTTDLQSFKQNFESKYGSIPDEYSFNGQNYSNAADLDAAYQKALAHEKALQNSASKSASRYASERDAEIAQRIQDAKNIKKAKLAAGALGAGAGIGALYAGARAMYGGDDTDTTDSIDNTDNTYTGEPDPKLKLENTPEGKDALNRTQQIDTGFDPDKAEAEAVLAGAAYDKGIEDGSSVKASDIVAADGNSIDDGLFELLKAMKDPYKADAIANYIYSRHGNDLDVQRLGWRGWLNRYGDSLRSKMGIDPSGYKGMHISGGL